MYQPCAHHPLSNAPFRANPPVLINFFANEREEPQEREIASEQNIPLAGLRSRSRADSTALGAIANIGGPSTDVDVSLYTIQQCLCQRGFDPSRFLKYRSSMTRLDSINLSPSTLFAALKIAEDVNHPF